MGRTIALLECFKTSYISKPLSENQQREITKICVVLEQRP